MLWHQVWGNWETGKSNVVRPVEIKCLCVSAVNGHFMFPNQEESAAAFSSIWSRLGVGWNCKVMTKSLISKPSFMFIHISTGYYFLNNAIHCVKGGGGEEKISELLWCMNSNNRFEINCNCRSSTERNRSCSDWAMLFATMLRKSWAFKETSWFTYHSI